jgi:lipopolysaccharide/colanic/teichoic acid biosynthesis glycosyltransferase
MDLVLSLFALIVLSPVMAVVAILIHLEDGGPIFFRQERCTLNGEKFMILKFRSMIVDAEKDGRPRPAGEEDDRITKIGHFIRATRIDELPQLVNIIKGEMSIVGPRPERVEHVEKYCADIPEFIFRQKVKGGLTGYAQVYGKYNTSALDKLKLDMIYIVNYSILMDIQIIFETVKVIFSKESTEGFSSKQQDAIRGAAPDNDVQQVEHI